LVHDFALDFGPFRKRIRAACVIAHRGFVEVVERPEPGTELEVSIGYAFMPYAPVPNPFGFGSGKFGTAVKLYSFRLTKDRRAEVRLTFATATRCEKVFDFGKRWPIPYTAARAYWSQQRLHDLFDAEMLALHCRVHQQLMDGSAKVWSDWMNPAVQRAGSSQLPSAVRD